MIIVDFVVWVVLGFVIGVELIDDVLSLVCVEVQLYCLLNILFIIFDVYKFDFFDDVFDVVYVYQVLQYVVDLVWVLQEMRWVCILGGIVVVCDVDYLGFIWFLKFLVLDWWLDFYEWVV